MVALDLAALNIQVQKLDSSAVASASASRFKYPAQVHFTVKCNW